MKPDKTSKTLRCHPLFQSTQIFKTFEVIPGPDCKDEITSFLMNYGSKFIGKTSVLAKDTPAFIGNRIGILEYNFISSSQRTWINY